jgi:hypothetical protein
MRKILFLFLLIAWLALPNLAQANIKAIAIVIDDSVQNSSSPYKNIKLKNLNDDPIQLQNISVSLNPEVASFVHYCTALDSFCDLPTDSFSSCQVGMTLAPHATCNIWLQAVAIGKINAEHALKIEVITPNDIYIQNFSMHYSHELYVAGRFEQWPEQNTTSAVVKWDGTNWSTLPGLDLGPYDDMVMSLARANSYLYAGGSFNGRVARYDLDTITKTWILLPGLPDAAATLANFAGEIYAGGDFSGAYRLNKLDQWQRVGDFSKSVNQYLVFNGEFYAAGEFADKVIMLDQKDKNSWLPVGSGLTSMVNSRTLVGLKQTLYTGGDANAYRIYQYRLQDPVKLWRGIDTKEASAELIQVGTVFQQQLYYGSLTGLYKLQGDTFQLVLPINSGRISALATVGNNLFVAGNYTSADGNLEFLTKYSHGQWTQIAPAIWSQINPAINAIIAVPNWTISAVDNIDRR